MKFRCTDNSIRVRVRKSELDTLKKVRAIHEELHFPGGNTLRMTLDVSGDVQVITGTFEHQQVRVSIPDLKASNWINTNEVGIENTLQLADDKTLHILIEKDFPCADRPDEDKSDTFWELSEDTC